MRRVLLAAALGAAGCFSDPGPPRGPAGQGGPWQMIQSTGTTSPDALGIAATTPGDVVVIAAEYTMTTQTFADGTGTTYLRVAGSVTSCPRAVQLAIWVGVPPASIAIVSAVGNAAAWALWEFRGIDPTPDGADVVPNGGNTTVPAGPPLTTTGDGELVVAAVIANGTIQGIHPDDDFVNDQILAGNGFAHVASNQVPAGTSLTAHWDQEPSDLYCSSAVAFRVGP